MRSGPDPARPGGGCRRSSYARGSGLDPWVLGVAQKLAYSGFEPILPNIVAQ